MALTKAPTSLAAGISTSQTTAAVDVSDAYGAGVYWSIVQVGVASTVASIRVQVSPDGGTTYYDLTPVAAGPAAGTYQGVVDLPDSATRVRLAFTAQAGGASSTLTAQVGEVTGL